VPSVTGIVFSRLLLEVRRTYLRKLFTTAHNASLGCGWIQGFKLDSLDM
jgi:hypothetical protein